MEHGVSTGERPTSIASIIKTGNTAIIIGTAPINKAKDPKVNEVVLCFTEKEALEYLGYSDDWNSYTLCESIDSFFRLFKVGPVAFINVLDPKVHKTSDTENVTLENGVATTKGKGILVDSLQVSNKESGVDYITEFNDDDTLSIIALTNLGESISITYDKLVPSLVDEDDIVGGVDINTYKNEGMALIPSVFTKYNRVPNIGLAPGWTHIPLVAQTLVSSMKNINDVFGGIALTDLECETNNNYSKVVKWKTDNSYIHENQYNLWPMGKLGDKIYHLSSLVAASIYAVDANNGDMPFESPSNKPLNITGMCLKSGEDVSLDLGQANYLNKNGIATCLNFNTGWNLWGNRTACYPMNTDPKDNFLHNKRMFIWDNNNFTLTYWLDVDKPATPKLMDKIVDSYNDYYSGLVTKGAILGGRIEFNSDENPTTDLIDGKYYFSRYMTPVGVAESIKSDLEYDTQYLKTLFGGGN